MLRYIKADGTWIDTLMELKLHKKVYMVIDNRVICINLDGSEVDLGKLQEEKDCD